jgi:hypothetical protein
MLLYREAYATTARGLVSECRSTQTPFQRPRTSFRIDHNHNPPRKSNVNGAHRDAVVGDLAPNIHRQHSHPPAPTTSTPRPSTTNRKKEIRKQEANSPPNQLLQSVMPDRDRKRYQIRIVPSHKPILKSSPSQKTAHPHNTASDKPRSNATRREIRELVLEAPGCVVLPDRGGREEKKEVAN